MDNVLTPVRDLTDSDQNQAVLDLASALIKGGLGTERAAGGYGPAVPREADAEYDVLTPPSIVRVIARGYPVGVHPSAASGEGG